VSRLANVFETLAALFTARTASSASKWRAAATRHAPSYRRKSGAFWRIASSHASSQIRIKIGVAGSPHRIRARCQPVPAGMAASQLDCGWLLTPPRLRVCGTAAASPRIPQLRHQSGVSIRRPGGWRLEGWPRRRGWRHRLAALWRRSSADSSAWRHRRRHRRRRAAYRPVGVASQSAAGGWRRALLGAR